MHQLPMLRHQESSSLVLLVVLLNRVGQGLLVVVGGSGPCLLSAFGNHALIEVVGIVDMGGSMPLQIGAVERFPNITMA